MMNSGLFPQVNGIEEEKEVLCMAETTTTGLPQLDVDAVAAAVACVGQGED